MDRLQPLITHKFWVVFGGTLLLSTVGWWLGTGQLKSEIDTKREKAEQAFASVPTPAVAQNTPNPEWAEGLAKRNELLEGRYADAREYLWRTQYESFMASWPESIRDDVQQLAYRAPIPVEYRDLYRIDYFNELEELGEIVDRFDTEENEGKVEFPQDAVQPQVNRDEWQTLPPKSERMWNVQEDLWMFRSLLSAIAEVNRAANTITDAPIRRIDALELHGGNPDALEAQESGEGPVESESEEYTGRSNLLLGSSRRRGRGSGEGGSQSSIDVEPEEVFGPATVQPDATTPGGTEEVESPSGAGATQERRYVDDDENAPFKTRGFYLKLVMRHRHLPDLLVQLSSSLELPVEILRVHQAARLPDYTRGNRTESGRVVVSPRERSTSRTGAEYRRGSRSGDSSGVLNAALEDAYLAEVVILGKLTIYRQPEDLAEEGEPSAEDGSAPAGTRTTAETPAGDETAAGEQADGEAENGEPGANGGQPDPGETPAPSTQPEGSEPPASEPAAPGEDEPDDPAQPQPNTDTETDSSGAGEPAAPGGTSS